MNQFHFKFLKDTSAQQRILKLSVVQYGRKATYQELIYCWIFQKIFQTNDLLGTLEIENLNEQKGDIVLINSNVVGNEVEKNINIRKALVRNLINREILKQLLKKTEMNLIHLIYA